MIEIRMRGAGMNVAKVIEGGSDLGSHHIVGQGLHLEIDDLDLYLGGLRTISPSKCTRCRY